MKRNPHLVVKTVFLQIFVFLLTSIFALDTSAQKRTNPDNQSEELGKVSWYRDYDQAVKLAHDQGKAILILFQEIPGCATCRNYGHNVLTHPLMVEAIENSFIPLAIYNNKGGKDREILKKFKEPSWNNPVVRIVSDNGWDIVPRVAGNYSSLGLYKAMSSALKQRDKTLPEYMKLLGEELVAVDNNNVKEKYFKMYCFWSGEKHLGKVEGVLSTKAGFLNGYEVVKVKYDERFISENLLDEYADKASCSPIGNGQSYRYSDRDHLFYLQKTAYKYIPLTEIQKTKINSALGSGQSGKRYLSPQQEKWLNQVSKTSNPGSELFDKDILTAWSMKSATSKNLNP